MFEKAPRRMCRLLRPPACHNQGQLRRALLGKTVLITGASSGIGAATALLFGIPGVRLVLVARREPELEALCTRIRAQGGQADYHCLDLNDGDAALALGAKLIDLGWVPDVVISNAGKSIRRRAEASMTRPQDIRRCVLVNFLGPALLLQSLLPAMLARGGAQVVNVSSVSARLPAVPYWSAYQSSKSGFDVWFRALALELAGQGATLSSLYLPLVHTPMSAPSAVFNRVPGLLPEDAAASIAHALVTRRQRIAPWWLWPCECLAPLLEPVVGKALRWRFQRGENQ